METSPKVLSKPPTLSKDESLDALLKTKLRLEAELEATREIILPELPDDGKLDVAEASLYADVDRLQRALLYFRQQNATLEKQEQSLSTSLERCSEIEAELTKCVDAPASEAEVELVHSRTTCLNAIFLEMRTFLKDFLGKVNENNPRMTIGDTLQQLCSRMMDFPHDPYLELSDLNCNDETLMFLLKVNLVQRHSYYPTKIRMLDPRR